MSVEIAGLFKSVSITAAAFVALWAGVEVADNRYELKQVHNLEHEVIEQTMSTLSYTAIKQAIRDIRELMSKTSDPNRLAELRLDLQDAIDMLCREFPQDRACK